MASFTVVALHSRGHRTHARQSRVDSQISRRMQRTISVIATNDGHGDAETCWWWLVTEVEKGGGRCVYLARRRR